MKKKFEFIFFCKYIETFAYFFKYSFSTTAVISIIGLQQPKISHLKISPLHLHNKSYIGGLGGYTLET